MGLFGRRRPVSATAGPPERGACACTEHVEELAELPVPLTLEMREELPDEQPMRVAELTEMSALGVDPCETAYFFVPVTGRREDGPYHWTVWVGDEARLCYDDDAPLPLDDSLRGRPGVERVLWEDREVLHVGAPTMCADGVLAAAARALLDPRVRLGEDD